MGTGARGTFVICWSQTELDGIHGAPVDALIVGATWRWTGAAARIDGARDVLILEDALGMDNLRQRAADKVRRIAKDRVDFGVYDPEDESNRLFDGSFDVTDGHLRYTICLIDQQGHAPLLMFLGPVPPADRDLWVVSIDAQPVRRDCGAAQDAVVCFTSGTRIATEQGAVPVETLRGGDRILTKDNGPQELIWTGGRRLSGARLHAMPQLRPVRLRASALGVDVPDDELIVSPQHRIVVRGPVARALFNTDEVLACARDLVNDRTIVIDRQLRQVSYVHLMLDAHQVVFANGVETESFHPDTADLDALPEAQRHRLMAAMPDLARAPHHYGGFARRQLTSAEAAILHHGAM